MKAYHGTAQALAIIFDVDDVGIANPITADSNGNYSFKAIDNIYDIIVSENTANEVKLEKVEIAEVPTAPILINDLSQAYNFATVSLMGDSLNIFPVGKTIKVKEHTATKGGGAIWDVVLSTSGTAGAGFVLSAVAGLAFKLRIVDHMNVKQWGMFGTVNEDSIWQDVINSGLVNIFLNRSVNYEINSLFAVDGQVIKGNGCNILFTGANQMFTIANGEMRDMTFDGNDDEHTTYPSEILAGEGVVLDNIKYENFHGKSTFSTYCLKWEMWGVHNFTINRCRFKNITQDDNGVIVGRGFVGAIRMSSTALGTDNDTSYGKISNVRGENIYSVNAGAGVVQDSDMIRFFWDPANGDISDMNWDIKFNKITAVNIGKRVFKTGGISGCSIKAVRCYKNDGLYDAMFSVVSLSGDSNRWDVTDVKGEGEFQRGFEISGRDHQISHVGLTATTPDLSGFQFGSVAFPCFNVIVDNVNLKGFGQSLYFYDSFNTQVSNYQSDSNLGINTNNTSGGNSNTVSNGVHKDAIIIDQGALLFINNCKIVDYPASLTAYAFDLRSGSVNVRGLNITSNSAKRMMNLALQDGQVADLDDISLIRNGAADVITNDHNIFSMEDAVVGSLLRIGKMKVISNANPAGTPSGSDGRANVNAEVAGTGVSILAATSPTVIESLKLANGVNNGVAAYVGTEYLQGGSTVVNTLNTPTTITIP